MSWNKLIRPLFFQLDAETAHYTAMNAYMSITALPLVAAQMRRCYHVNDNRLESKYFGLTFTNPVGLAAGFDKAGRWFNELSHLGFGCVEIGTVTGHPQPGNPKPRLFRLPDDKAIVNRMGFNSDGCENVAKALEKKASATCVLGINIGKTTKVSTDEAPADYCKSFERLFPFADYFTVNVSCPNVPNSRELQDLKSLRQIVSAVKSTNEDLAIETNTPPKPILLKIAPNLGSQDIKDIADLTRQYSLSGVIATNTINSRDDLDLKSSEDKIKEVGKGGLSGQPLKKLSLRVVSELYGHLQGRVPIVGVGGISNGEDAWNMICAGANLVQLYTGFIYGGPSIVRDINRHLVSQLNSRGFKRIADAVGSSANRAGE